MKIKLKFNNGELEIIGNTKSVRYVKKYLIETDIGETICEFCLQRVIDFLIYGYYPWDYKKELELNIKYQRFYKR